MDVSSNLTSAYVNTIDDMEFFQGDTVTIPFKFLDSNGDVIDLTGGDTMKWYLCPFGQFQAPAIVLSSENPDEIFVDPITSVAYVKLNDSITGDLTYGKYVQQPVLYHNLGTGNTERYLRAQGNVLFKYKIRDF